MGQNFHKQKRSGWKGLTPPPPPKRSAWPLFPSFFYAFPKHPMSLNFTVKLAYKFDKIICFDRLKFTGFTWPIGSLCRFTTSLVPQSSIVWLLFKTLTGWNSFTCPAFHWPGSLIPEDPLPGQSADIRWLRLPPDGRDRLRELPARVSPMNKLLSVNWRLQIITEYYHSWTERKD